MRRDRRLEKDNRPPNTDEKKSSEYHFASKLTKTSPAHEHQ